jgi:hypothetical protein
LSLGIDKKILGLEMNEIPISGIEELLAAETELVKQSESTEKIESDKE